jgi:hypothetical protein
MHLRHMCCDSYTTTHSNAHTSPKLLAPAWREHNITHRLTLPRCSYARSCPTHSNSPSPHCSSSATATATHEDTPSHAHHYYDKTQQNAYNKPNHSTHTIKHSPLLPAQRLVQPLRQVQKEEFLEGASDESARDNSQTHTYQQPPQHDAHAHSPPRPNCLEDEKSLITTHTKLPTLHTVVHAHSNPAPAPQIIAVL